MAARKEDSNNENESKHENKRRRGLKESKEQRKLRRREKHVDQSLESDREERMKAPLNSQTVPRSAYSWYLDKLNVLLIFQIFYWVLALQVMCLWRTSCTIPSFR